MDGWLDAWTQGCIDVRAHRCKAGEGGGGRAERKGWTDGRARGCVDAEKVGSMDGLMYGCEHTWVDRCMITTMGRLVV